jgi:UDP-N-acetylglucosamine 2-epimerase (non-hydrolysing)
MGTRPEAIKLAPVVRALERSRLEPVICSTGQHRELLEPFLTEFNLRPRHRLEAGADAADLATLTARIVERTGRVLREDRPHAVIVQGDTTSALAGAMASFYERVPVAHVEAGLRTHDPRDPFPEEVNRTLIARLADLHFAPTPSAARNLEREGVARVHVVGNTVLDALRMLMPQLPARKDPTIVVTIHRRENLDGRLEGILGAVRDLADALTMMRIVFPVHKNPAVGRAARRALAGHPRIDLVDPMGYGAFVRLMAGAALVVTDSGGIQEEAPALGTPVVVVRETTERPEGAFAASCRIAGTAREQIVSTVQHILADPELYARMSQARWLYGDGRAAERIVALLEQHLGRATRVARAQ